MKRLLWLLTIIALLWGWWLFGTEEATVPHAPGTVNATVPQQLPPGNPTPFQHAGFTLTPLADFSLRARVLGAERYRFDQGASLSPLDLALGWERMANPQVYQQLSISQSGRWYHYRWAAKGPPIPLAEIIRSSANMHLVPADDAVEAAMLKASIGDMIELQGELIRADGDNGWHWVSSLSRDDSGSGACELILVRRFQILSH